MHRMHPYRYDKIHERDLEFCLIGVNIDQPSIDERIFHGERERRVSVQPFLLVHFGKV